MQHTKTLSSKRLNWALKALFAALLCSALYYDLQAKDNLPAIWQAFLAKLGHSNSAWLLVTLALMPLNWWAEMKKWHQFVHRYQPFSQWQAYRAVLAGVSFSIFTPNRVGEYGGRILFVRRKHQWKAVIANLVGNFAQIMVLFAAGIAGAAWLALQLGMIDPMLVRTGAALAAVGLAAMFFIYFNIDLAVPLAKRIPLLNHVKRFVKDIRVLRQFKRRELAEILAWATFRYAIYAAQYFLLLQFFGIKTGIWAGFSGIAAIFLFQASVPLPPVVGLLARGNVAVQVWSHFGANEVSILAATFSLWIINLILPALAGAFFIFNVNISQSLGYEDTAA